MTKAAEGRDDKTVLSCVEEGLRRGSIGAIVGEIARLTMEAFTDIGAGRASICQAITKCRHVGIPALDSDQPTGLPVAS